MGRNKNIKIGLIALTAILLGYWVFGGSGSEEVNKTMITKVIKGDLPIEVIATGELKARNSQNIFAPSLLRSLGVSQIKISNMAAEGTILKQGDFVASLDPSEIGSKLSQLEIDKEQKLSDLKSSRLDTALSMRAERETILNLKYAMEESDLEVKQSKFEPPAVQRKAEITLEKANRNYNQAITNLKLKKQQAVSKVFKVQTELRQLEAKIQKMITGLQSLQVTAPQNGMLVYYSNWNGKVKPGSTVNTWNPIIASIPDLTEMISKTYVNEIDISKVKKGQYVSLSIDAFADKKITGEIISMANIGQQLSGSDAKVFEVEIKVIEQDSMLRPSMTTSNRIKINELKNALYIPIEAVFSEEVIQFVYAKDGNSFEKLEVKTGESSEEYIEILGGLNEGQEISLLAPENSDKLEIKLIK
ncbi:HlyD family efflux transporter periplasmic adaptor subunit [bacterium]|nr:HlyD family efflux transporter periplasmic adaptor subunit [bacterium]